MKILYETSKEYKIRRFVILYKEGEEEKVNFIVKDMQVQGIKFYDNSATIPIDGTFISNRQDGENLTDCKKRIMIAYNASKEIWKNMDHPAKAEAQAVPAVKPAKKVRRRNRQMVKAFKLICACVDREMVKQTISKGWKNNTCHYAYHSNSAFNSYKEKAKKGGYDKEFFTPFYKVA